MHIHSIHSSTIFKTSNRNSKNKKVILLLLLEEQNKKVIQLPFRFLFLSGIVAIVGVAPLGGTKALPGTEFEPRIAADFSGVKASTSLSLCEDPENDRTVTM